MGSTCYCATTRAAWNCSGEAPQNAALGVIGTLTLVIILNLTAFAIVREREVGTLEQIMVSPIRPVEFILGKTVPFFLVGVTQVSLVAAVGILWFQVPFVGNPFVLLLGTTLFLLSTLALGLLISTICSTQQQAFATNFFVLNLFFILSGFAFSDLQHAVGPTWFTYLNPLRYFMVVIRAAVPFRRSPATRFARECRCASAAATCDTISTAG